MTKLDDWPSNYTELFWNSYPRRVAKKDALRALEKVRKSGEVSFAQLMAGVRNYADAVRGKDMQYICHPATWLNAGRWDDEYAAIAGTPERRTTADVGRQVLAKLHAADSAAHDARGGREGGDADDERLHDVRLLGRVDADAVRGAAAVPAGNGDGRRIADPWSAEEVQGSPIERGTTH